MRIVAGAFRGRRLAAPKGEATRPTTDRVREAVFSSLSSLLGADLGGARVLDPFAGSGALGLEALSRGAAWATFVDRDRHALAALRANVSTLGVAATSRVMTGDAFALTRAGALGGEPFGLLLLDPPYRIPSAEVRAFIEALTDSGALRRDAVVVWEHAVASRAEVPEEFTVTAEKRYGDTVVTIAVGREGEG